MSEKNIPRLKVESTVFEDNGAIPRKYTGFGEDCSPPLKLIGLSAETVSIAVIMDDLDIPMIKAYNHWLIWNIPSSSIIPENIPYGPDIPLLGGAKQGIGYGKNRYRGPKQPVFIRKTHRYIFHVYALDCFLNIKSNSRKKQLLEAMKGHVIQHGSITGTYKRT